MSLHPRHIEVYSAPGCKYCRIAKTKLQELRLDYQDIDVSNVEEILESLSVLQRNRLDFTLATSLPQIYIGSEHIGGCDNLLEEIKAGKFDDRLKAAGVVHKKVSIECTSDTSTQAPSSLPFPTDLIPLPGEPLNSPRFLRNASQSSSINTLSTELQRLGVVITERFLDSLGRLEVVRAVHSPLFAEYVALSAQLTRPGILNDLSALFPQGKMVFFCNLYNAFALHASLLLPSPHPTPQAQGGESKDRELL
ncbi:hypothetical protein EON65_53940, partial [archaeon]